VLPWDGDAEFVQESHYNVHSLSVMSMGESVELDVEGAEAAPIPMGPGGPTLVNMERVGIPPGTPVRIAVSGISEGMETGAWLVILAAILMVVVIVYVVASRGRHNDTESADLAPPDIAEPADAAESDADARPAEADELAERIALLDEAFENEDIEESEYVEQRRELKKKLTSALRDEEL